MSLTHEKIHLEQNDSLLKLFSLGVQALVFFVPWSYYLHRRLELEMEIFCDMKTYMRTFDNSAQHNFAIHWRNSNSMTSGIARGKSIFDITSKILIDGKLVSSPRILSRANKLHQFLYLIQMEQ